MVCLYCNSETAVVNSRPQKRNNSTWRRRRCQNCQLVFSSEEKANLSSVYLVSYGSNKLLPFNELQLFLDIYQALGSKQAAITHAKDLTSTISANSLKKASKGLIAAQDISLEAAAVLKRYNKQAYLRFVSEHTSLQGK